MHSVCCCSLPVWRRSSLKKGTPRDLFWPRPGSAPGRIWPKNNNTCKGPWVLHPYQVSSKSIKRFWRRSWKCKLSNGRQTDGRDAGQRVITIGHWSLWLLCPKNIRRRELVLGEIWSDASMVFSDGGDTGTRYCLRTAGRQTKGYRISSTGLWPVELKTDITVGFYF